MDWFVAVFIVPEALLLLLGFAGLVIALKGHYDFSRFKPLFKPRGSEVGPTYWGQYIKNMNEPSAPTSFPQSQNTVAASTSVTASGIKLPSVQKAP
jgi:hypothetical protein